MLDYNAQKGRTKHSMPLWTDALVADTLELSVDEFGAYLLLLTAMWRRESLSLPDDPRKLRTISRVSQKLWNSRISPTLMPFYVKSDGQITHKKLREVANYVEAYLLTQSKRNVGKKPSKP